MALTPVIPESITVHLGRPEAPARNVTVPFIDYIKNVASSEIYPTWPESAIRANIYAQISYALNRVYTSFYRSQGYDFDITNSTAFDQSYVYGRDVFENISIIVDDIFNSYVRRQGNVEPLFTAYCDGDRVQCNGLSQWGSVTLANRGLTPYEILQYYYGNDIDIVQNAPVGSVTNVAPQVPLTEGQINPFVELLQIRLNRISANYPAIPKIYPTDGVFGRSTTEAVKEFQRIFSLTPDGIVGPATWYKVLSLYNGIKRLSDLNSEGLTLGEISTTYPNVLRLGDVGEGVLVLQYFLAYISRFLPSVPEPAIDGFFGTQTENAVLAFQNAYGLSEDGTVGELTWNRIYNVYRGLIASIPIRYTEGVTLPYPGEALTLGSEGSAVTVLQEYLNYIASTYPEIPRVRADGIFGTGTQAAVIAFQNLFDVPGEGRGIVTSVTWNAITNVYDDLYNGNRANPGQYPGYDIR